MISVPETLKKDPLPATREFLADWRGLLLPSSVFEQGSALPVLEALAPYRMRLPTQNNFVRLAPDETDPEYTDFYVENQGIYIWAFRPTDLEPKRVYVLSIDGVIEEPWVEEESRLDRFLLEALVFESAWDFYSTSAEGIEEALNGAPIRNGFGSGISDTHALHRERSGGGKPRPYVEPGSPSRSPAHLDQPPPWGPGMR